MQLGSKVQEAISNFQTDQGRPASLIHDINCFLNLLSEKMITLTAGKGQPPLKWVQALNIQLSEPELIDLKRPVSKHYGKVLGLFLLIRATGLGLQKRNAKGRAVLQINEPVYEQWQAMNSVERYFSLLEAWINRGHAAAIGERMSGWDDRFFSGLIMEIHRDSFWQGEYEPEDSLDYVLRRGLSHSLRIMESLGLADIRLADNNRQLHSLRLTPWGSVMLTACRDAFKATLMEYETVDSQVIDLLPAIQRCHTDFNKTLEQPLPEVPASYVLDVRLKDQDPPCSRRLQVSSGHSFEQLAYGILNAFGFDDEDHPYHFEYLDDFGRCFRIGHEAVDDSDAFAHDVLIKDIFPRIGGRVQFIFDYGDWWEFELKFESLSEQTVKNVHLLSRKGEAPKQYPMLDESDYC